MFILPTISRPEQCARVIAAMQFMGCTTPLRVVVNGTDPDYKKWLNERWLAELPFVREVVYSDTNLGALGTLNRVFKEFPDEPFYGFIADDEFIETPNFDKRLIEAAGDWNVSHGNIGPNVKGEYGKRAQGFLCIGGKLARAVGYLAIPECFHWYGLDDLWERLAEAKACGRVYLEDIIIEHKHPYMNKEVKADECNALAESRVGYDRAAYVKWLWDKDGCAGAINRVKSARE